MLRTAFEICLEQNNMLSLEKKKKKYFTEEKGYFCLSHDFET